MNTHTTIKQVVKNTGLKKAAEACGVSQTAVQKWMKNGRLPRTEWTGESRHAEVLAGIGSHGLSADQIRQIGYRVPDQAA